MELSLYDTWERRVRPFEPLDGDAVRLYCCGPTVYNFAHIGNLRTYLFEDLLRRTLEYAGYRVNHVVNITDVGHLTSDADTGEDKMEVGSRRTGESVWDIAARYTEAFQADLEHLNVLAPTTWCKATDYIDEQIGFIADIESKGYTYATADGIYFDTSRLNDYGFLARLAVDGLQAGARVELGEKRNPTDFALWKFSPEDEQRQMEWDSPWGRGFPGWHIECSAMSEKLLGEFFDIHCGGQDHISVHHTNEIAQTQARHGTRLANFWMHGYFLNLGQEKMAKSAGEFLRLESLIERGYDPLAYRYLCLTAHYRSELSFSWDGLDAAASALTRLRRLVTGWPAGGRVDQAAVTAFDAHLAADLNAPRAIAVAWEVARGSLPEADRRATLEHFDRVLGLELGGEDSVEIPAAVATLVEAREAARAGKDFARADALRAEIEAAGFDLKDTREGPQLTPR